MFLFQRTYSMSDMFQFCPDFALEYSSNLEKVVTTVPLRFSVVSERYDDAAWSVFQQREFAYNRDEPIHRFISDSLRQQSNLDVLSGKSSSQNQKHAWIESACKRFNIVTLFNYHFLEYIDTVLAAKE